MKSLSLAERSERADLRARELPCKIAVVIIPFNLNCSLTNQVSVKLGGVKFLEELEIKFSKTIDETKNFKNEAKRILRIEKILYLI